MNPEARIFLRKHSALYRRISPPGRMVRVCDSCHDENLIGLNHASTAREAFQVPRHLIGEVWIEGVRHDKWCTGEETP